MTAAEHTEPVLRRLLRAAGYRLEERPSGLYGFRARDRRAILVVGTTRSPADLAGDFPRDALHKTLIYPEDPGPVARDLASHDGIEVLDENTLGPALGELLLNSPIDDSAAPGLPPPPVEPPAAVFPDGPRTVRARLGASDASVIAGVDGFRTRLRLVPFYVAPYRVRVPSPTGVPGAPTDHLVAVNALTGQVEEWDPGEREVGEEPAAEQVFSPRLSERECREAAGRELRTRHTISVDHTEQHGGTIVIERRRVAPAPGDLQLGAGVFLRVPFWYVEGREGRYVIDAVNGARAAADLPEAR